MNAGSVGLLTTFMLHAGALAQEVAPLFPQWPPAGLSAARAAEARDHLVEGAPLALPLSEAERSAVQEHLDGCARATDAPSATPGRVPDYKFISNDSWWVSPAECRTVADALTRFTNALTQDILDDILRPFEAERQRVIEHFRRTQGFAPVGLEGPPLSLQSACTWLREFAAYNALAESHGGFRVR